MSSASTAKPVQPLFRTRLEQILVREGRKQIWLAEQIGATRGFVSQVVGGYHCSDAMQTAIAEALGRTVDDCFGEVQD